MKLTGIRLMVFEYHFYVNINLSRSDSTSLSFNKCHFYLNVWEFSLYYKQQIILIGI